MKNVVLACLLLLGGLTVQASALLCSSVNNSQATLSDWRPWPWGSEISVPWKDITGVWQVSDGSCENLFLFKVKTDQNGEKMVSIVQYDPVQCKVIAQGLGYETNRYIIAQMVRHGQSYNLTIHAFNQEDVSVNTKNLRGGLRSQDSSGKVVLALTLSPIGRFDDKSAFEISKLSNDKTMICDK